MFLQLHILKKLAREFAELRILKDLCELTRENGKVKMENGRIPVHPGSFVKSVKTKGLEHKELGRVYGTL